MKKHMVLLVLLVMLLTACNMKSIPKPTEGINLTESQPTSTNETTVSDNMSSTAETNKESEILNTTAVNDQEPEQSTDKEDALNIEITANGRTFSAALYDNETAKAFKERLPLTLDMSELNGNEKYYYLPDSLPRNPSKPSRINTGDIMLYGSDCLVIFYESFSTSYSYTPIGKIHDPDELAAALGSGSVQVTLQ